jgi:AraC family transcriptional activator of pobA
MKFQGLLDESIFVAEILPERSFMFNQDLKTGLSIIWNTGGVCSFKIDNQDLILNTDEVIFLTEYHRLDNFVFEKMNVLQFNRPFHCIEKDDTEVGCRGLLFFGASQIPRINIPEDKKKQFNLLWEVFLMEMEEKDHLKLEMLQGLLKRFLILCLRIYKIENSNLPSDNVSFGLIKEYNYLVEKHYKEFSKVSDYADLLHKSPKTLSNIFGKYLNKTPLQILSDRRLLESKRLLKYSDMSIQKIAYEVNFSDVQSFSRFFRSMTGDSPTVFRKK